MFIRITQLKADMLSVSNNYKRKTWGHNKRGCTRHNLKESATNESVINVDDINIVDSSQCGQSSDSNYSEFSNNMATNANDINIVDFSECDKPSDSNDSELPTNIEIGTQNANIILVEDVVH